MSIWALIAFPPRFHAAVRFDDNAAKVSIFGGMPLMLQQWAEAIEVWTRCGSVFDVHGLTELGLWVRGSPAYVQTLVYANLTSTLCFCCKVMQY